MKHQLLSICLMAATASFITLATFCSESAWTRFATFALSIAVIASLLLEPHPPK